MHKQFFLLALPNKAVINKVPALPPFQDARVKQDAQAAENTSQMFLMKYKRPAIWYNCFTDENKDFKTISF